MGNDKWQKRSADVRPDSPVVRLRNLTPHEVVILGEGPPLVLMPEVPAVRLGVRRWGTDRFRFENHVVEVDRVSWDEVIDLPDEEPATLLIVSGVLAMELQMRDDLVFPTKLVRDAAGRVIACSALARVHQPKNETGKCANELSFGEVGFGVAQSFDSDDEGAS